MNKLKSCVQDTADSINKPSTNEGIPTDSVLVSLDVISLYINILKNKGLEAVCQKLHEQQRSP